METIPQEKKRVDNVFPFVEEQMKEKLLALQADPSINSHYMYGGALHDIREGNKEDEMIARAQMNTRAVILVQEEAEDEMRKNLSSKELYLRVEMAAKLAAFYRKMEGIYSFVAETRSRKNDDMNFMGMEKVLKEEFIHLNEQI